MRPEAKTLLSLGLVLLSACASDGAPNFGGSWQPVNRYPSAAATTPTYVISARDGSLRPLLQRWSAQGGLQLEDRLSQDYPLPATLTGFRHLSLPQALLALQTLYAHEQVMLELQGRQLLAWQDGPGDCAEAAC